MYFRTTGLSTKDETVKTTQNFRNMAIWTLVFGFCIQWGRESRVPQIVITATQICFVQYFAIYFISRWLAITEAEEI